MFLCICVEDDCYWILISLEYKSLNIFTIIRYMYFQIGSHSVDKLSSCEPYSKLLVQTVAVITLYNQLALPKTFLIKDSIHSLLTLQCLEWCACIVMYLKLEAKNLYSCTLHSYSRHWQSLHVGSDWFSFIFKKYFLPKDMKETQYESFKLYSEEEENCCEEIT